MSTRSTALRRKHRRTIAKTKPDCALCGNPIDYDAHWLDPMSFTVDHITPINKGGADALANKQAAHRCRRCNRLKSDRVPGPRLVTSRTW